MNSLQLYEQVVERDLILKLAFKNATQCPKLVQADLSVSNKLINAEKLVLLPYFLALLLVTGQKPSVIRAKKSVATFHLKKGALFGCFVTLRKQNLSQFFLKFCLTLFPKVQKLSRTNFVSFQNNKVDFGFDSFLKCVEIQPNTDLFDFLSGCSCSLKTSSSNQVHTKIFMSGLQFPVFQKNS